MHIFHTFEEFLMFSMFNVHLKVEQIKNMDAVPPLLIRTAFDIAKCTHLKAGSKLIDTRENSHATN